MQTVHGGGLGRVAPQQTMGVRVRKGGKRVNYYNSSGGFLLLNGEGGLHTLNIRNFSIIEPISDFLSNDVFQSKTWFEL